MDSLCIYCFIYYLAEHLFVELQPCVVEIQKERGLINRYQPKNITWFYKARLQRTMFKVSKT